MRKLVCVRNTYQVFNQGNQVGWIRFVRYVDQLQWLIEEVSDDLPLDRSYYNAEQAKRALTEANLTWQHGENKPFYIYVDG